MQNSQTLTGYRITPLHVERGRQMRSIVQSDIVKRGMSYDEAIDSLSEYLGVDRETVLVGIGIVNGVEDGTLRVRS